MMQVFPSPIMTGPPQTYNNTELAPRSKQNPDNVNATTHSGPWNPQRTPGAQASRQVPAQCSAALNEEGLIDGFMADPHRVIPRKVDLQSS